MHRSVQATTARTALTVAVPNLPAYSLSSGIGRVLHSLRDAWGPRVQLVGASFRASPLPVLRNLPRGVLPPPDADLVLLPQLTGAQAFASTHGVPGVVNVHDIGVVDFPGDRQAMDLLTRESVKLSFRGLLRADVIITGSAFTRERLLAHLPALADRVRVVPYGVGDSFLSYSATRAEARAAVERLIGALAGAPVVLNVGSELPRKNLGLLFAAFALLRARFPDAVLVKAGAAGHPRWREQTLRLAAAHRLMPGRELRFVAGSLSDADLAALYRAADVVVTPSLYEGFGLPALEAMAVGTPVVVTACGSLPEVVGEAGFVVAPEPGPMAAAIKEALSGEHRERRVEAGRRRAASLTWARAGDSFLAIFHGLVASPDGARGEPKRSTISR